MIKDPALSPQELRLLLWLGFNPRPRDLPYNGHSQKKKKKKKKKEKERKKIHKKYKEKRGCIKSSIRPRGMILMCILIKTRKN